MSIASITYHILSCRLTSFINIRGLCSFILNNQEFSIGVSESDIKFVCDNYFKNYVAIFITLGLLIVNKGISMGLGIRMYLYYKNLYDEAEIKTRRRLYYLKRKKEIYDKLFGQWAKTVYFRMKVISYLNYRHSILTGQYIIFTRYNSYIHVPECMFW